MCPVKRNLHIKVVASAMETVLLLWVRVNTGDDCGRRGMNSHL